ncbi:MAG TPA: SMP-30/gluconolactonase/LRE family protein [Gammaproteobacteria bacterium]
MAPIRLLKTLPVANSLGECVLWNDIEQSFYWTDILEKKLYRWHPRTDRLASWNTPERLCSFGFVDGDSQSLIAAFESGVAIYQPDNGRLEWLAKPEAGVTGTRFNDGRVDRQGRFWSGTMVETDRTVDAAGNPSTAGLYRIVRGECAKMESGFQISNSLCWNRNSSKLYFADSPARAIYVYDFDPTAGTPADRRLFLQTEVPAEPDGSCIDADDHLWNAQWGGGKVVRYHPNGCVDIEVPLPVTQPTCVCFGGPELNWLAITTAKASLDESESARQPLAGNLFVFETPYKGLPESRYIR